ncbi:uncharacterized protein isoform X1 [Musca autumnalis]|uniref:uncharacterized protein isoform X1 n=1 Tax=Musca autumnalis TaxID=221902 RepID=UPI003CF06864
MGQSCHHYSTISDHYYFSDWLSEMANLICIIHDVDNKEQKRRVLLHSTSQQIQCIFCKGQHKIYDCRRFLNLNVQDRWKQIKQIRACFSCLNIGHITRDCRRSRLCPIEGCQRRHNKLLHEGAPCVPSIQPSNCESESQQNVLSCSSEVNKKLLFRVLPVTLYGNNCRMDVYALFDDGSSITMMDKDIAEKIGIRGKSCSLNIQWFGGRSAKEPVTSFNVKVSGVNKKSCHLMKNVYAVSNLNLPMQSLNQKEIEAAFKNNQNPAVKPYSNIVPKLLIGLDNAFLGLPTITNFKDLSGPFACNTELGWVVFGPCKSISSSQSSCLFVSVEEDRHVHKMVEDYFNIDSMGVRAAPLIESDDDIRAKEILHESTKRVGNRFQTGLLWKNENVELPDSYTMALRRLEGVERKMKRDSNLYAAYAEVINGYIAKGYIKEVPLENISLISNRKWYLPHFGVINPNKENKKLRLVFDAAAKVNGTSLNDNLLKGPQYILSLPSILYSFRRGNIAVCADIREMFHQVIIQPRDRISERLLWRNCNPDIEPVEYEMTVMTFGAACSPCSAIYVMKTNAKEHIDCHPRAIESICEHHYMDDFVDSFHSVDEAIEISKQVTKIHKNGGFEHRGFISNSNDVMLALDGLSSSKIIAPMESGEKVLGLYWDPGLDTFMFNLKFSKVDPDIISGQKIPTKRQVLSIIMSMFDPLGFSSNFMVGGKLILRNIWITDCVGDEEIPKNIDVTWQNWRNKLINIKEFSLNRYYFPPGKSKKLELHIFVDASKEAFAAVAYWRFVTSENEIGVSFICSKTKCSPLKRVSIPRLELQAAVLGTRKKQNILAGVPPWCNGMHTRLAHIRSWVRFLGQATSKHFSTVAKYPSVMLATFPEYFSHVKLLYKSGVLDTPFGLGNKL